MTESGKDGSALDITIQLLKHTRKLVELFSTSKNAISAVNNIKTKELDSFLMFFSDWNESCDNPKHFISSKLWFDLQSMVHGFKAIVMIKLTRFPNSVIKPWMITNQDVVENNICQIMAKNNGQNNNPSYRLQESTQNSIRIGQTTISLKCNARV